MTDPRTDTEVIAAGNELAKAALEAGLTAWGLMDVAVERKRLAQRVNAAVGGWRAAMDAESEPEP